MNDPSVLSSRRAILFFSQSSLSLAYGFLDWRTGVALRRSFGLKDLEFLWRRYKTAVDGSAADDYSVRYLFPVGDRTDLSFTLGDAKAEGFDDVYYLVVGVTYYR